VTEIKMGNKVKDIITTIEGIAVQRVEQSNGNILWAVQPPYKEDGTAVDPMFIDQQSLIIVGDGVADRAIDCGEPLYGIGVRVKDKPSSFEGTIIEVGQWLNGCTIYIVVSETLSDDGRPVTHAFSQERLEPSAKPALDTLKPSEGPRTGGPNRRAPSNSRAL
jgi:hypothetical protein